MMHSPSLDNYRDNSQLVIFLVWQSVQAHRKIKWNFNKFLGFSNQLFRYLNDFTDHLLQCLVIVYSLEAT